MFDLVQRTSTIARIALVILYAANLWNDHSLVAKWDEHVVDPAPAIVTVNIGGNISVEDDLHHPTIKDHSAMTYPREKHENDGALQYSHASTTPNVSVTPPTLTCTSPRGNGTTWSVPAFPHLIIVGAAKAGTTALSHFLGQAPNFQRTTPSEPHFWDGVMHGKSPHRWSSHAERCKLLQQYHSYWPLELIGPETITFEKTPSLLAISSKAGMIRSLLDPHPPKILIVLRNPVDRFYSNYKMNYQRNRGMAKRSIAENIQWEVAKLRNLSVLNAPTLSRTTQTWNQSDFVVTLPSTSRDFDWRWSMVARGFYAPQIERYMRHFPLGTSLKVIQYEKFTKHKVETLNEIMDWLGVPPYYNWTDHELEQHYGPVQKSTKDRPIPSKIKRYLEHLYRPFNERLEVLLGDEWRGVWDNDNLLEESR